jgi:hypothetical protein
MTWFKDSFVFSIAQIAEKIGEQGICQKAEKELNK